MIVVAFYYFRLRGYLTSVHPKTARTYDDDSRESTPEIPEWRQKRDEQPPRALERNLRHEHPMIEVGFKGMPNGRHNIVQRLGALHAAGASRMYLLIRFSSVF